MIIGYLGFAPKHPHFPAFGSMSLSCLCLWPSKMRGFISAFYTPPKKALPSLISRHILGRARRLLSPIVSIRWFVTGKHVGRVVRRHPVCGLRQKATIPRSASAMANQFSGAVDKSKEFCHLTWMFYYRRAGVFGGFAPCAGDRAVIAIERTDCQTKRLFYGISVTECYRL